MKILLIHLSGIGNTVTILPLINKIKRIHPDSELDILLANNRGCENIIDNNENIDKIYFMDDLPNINKIGKFLFVYHFSQKLPKFDVSYTTYPNQGVFSALLMFFASKQRIQHKYNYGSFLLSQSRQIRYTNFVEQNLNLLNEENRQNDYILTYQMKQYNEEYAQNFINKFDRKIIIGIHPGGFKDMQYKQYSAEKWNIFIKELNNLHNNIVFFVFGGPGDNLDVIKEQNNLIKIDNLPLEKTIALISKVDLFLSNDSGLSHIASIFNKKQLVLFGATDPEYSKAYSNNAIAIIPSKFKPFYIPHQGIVDNINYNINNIDVNTLIKKVNELI